MPSQAQARLAARVAVGTLWGGVMFVAGLSVIARHADRFPGTDLLRMMGVGLAASGMFVFTCVVADRLFPRADARLCGGVQVLLGLLQVAGLVCLAIYIVRLNLDTL